MMMLLTIANDIFKMAISSHIRLLDFIMLRFVILCYTCGASIDLYGMLIAFCRLKQTEEGRDHIGLHKGKVIRLYYSFDVRIICITIKEKVRKFNLACISSLFEVGRICGV